MVRRHTDKNCNNRKNKPAVQLHTQGPLRFQFLLELALANTQTEPSERLAARCISDNAYSPPAPETSDPSCKGSRKLSKSSTYWNHPEGEKFRKPGWLISTIPLKFNHL